MLMPNIGYIAIQMSTRADSFSNMNENDRLKLDRSLITAR
jgi:hypothetical protein